MTSGATGQIVPVFRSVLSRRALLRVAMALHSLFFWLLLLARGLRLRRAGSGADASALEAGAGSWSWNERRRLYAAEEEDVRRRRALVEEDRSGTRWATFLVTGARRNALFCRLWAPAADVMRYVVSTHDEAFHCYCIRKPRAAPKGYWIPKKRGGFVENGSSYCEAST